ncbi:MAG: hypothetical protein KF832_04760 [Caldilineaceae bacterium]|nr:hypothetical protein [Caldilineaceae bacterium]
MQIVIVAPALVPQAPTATGTMPPRGAIHLAASIPVRHRVTIIDTMSALHAHTVHAHMEQADRYVLLWSTPFSPLLIEIAIQLATCEQLLCVWEAPTAPPVDYLLEFVDRVLWLPHGVCWQQLRPALGID